MLSRIFRKTRSAEARLPSDRSASADARLFDPPEAPMHPLWRGSDARLYAAALALRGETDWVEASYPEPDSEIFYFWLVNFGLRLRPAEIGPYLPPIPAGDRLWAVSGTEDIESFLNAGAESAQRILELLEACGLDPFGPRRVLDFGCGCARVLRHLLPLADRQELWGSDIDEKAIAFCRASIGRARFVANRSAPPLPFASGSFDFVFSISVFTHLGRLLHDAWVAELRRVIVTGGRAAVSIHGERAWERLNGDAAFRRQMLVSERELEGARNDWESTGFAFLSHLVPDQHDDPDPYGLVFIRPEVLPSLWPGFELERLEPGALSDWQDLLTLRAV